MTFFFNQKLNIKKVELICKNHSEYNLNVKH